MAIKENYIIEKSNILVELKNTKMTLQELRFFCVYLSKINPRDISTRRVCFSLSDFQKIMGFGKFNIKQIKQATNNLLCKPVNISNDDGGYTGFTLFNLVRVFKDDFENWNLEIDVSDNALSLFFNLKGNYLSYQLWNVLNLNSVNQIRIYELLKRYEKLGIYEIKISDLREYLCISDKYSRLLDFKTFVLDNCQKALAENTDICYTYECGKRGSRGKWLSIIFRISKNDKQFDVPELDGFIDNNSASQSDCPSDERLQPSEQLRPYLSSQPYLSGDFEKDLSEADIKVLCNMLSCKVLRSSEREPNPLRKRLKLLYGRMIVNSTEPIRNPAKYLCSCIEHLDPDKLPSLPDDSFDVDMYEKICINNYEVNGFIDNNSASQSDFPSDERLQPSEQLTFDGFDNLISGVPLHRTDKL